YQPCKLGNFYLSKYLIILIIHFLTIHLFKIQSITKRPCRDYYQFKYFKKKTIRKCSNHTFRKRKEFLSRTGSFLVDSAPSFSFIERIL
ncbi:hypothetical protein JZM21_24025, partial [Escherichia coli]|uniref:hypothetical protein n=1 Tax=Escherichia coli TaxID=562 RepID=UPI0019D31397